MNVIFNNKMMSRLQMNLFIFFSTINFVSGQKIKLKEQNFIAVQSSISIDRIKGKKVIKIIKSPEVIEDDEATFARVKGINFKNGIIKVKVFSKLLKTAPAHARGFIGVAFHINNDNSKFESIYIRPTNGRAEDQLRRNRTVQYFSYPDFKYTDSRSTAPGVYETYADINLNEWIDLKIEVRDSKAKLYINGAKNPSFIVNDLKMGGNNGFIGLFVDVGTEGYFRNLKISE